MERTGGAHIQTHATLKSMNEFAMGELNAMVIAGVSSQNPSLPRKQQGDRDAQARATIHADEQSLSPMAAAVNNQMAKGLRTSHTTAPWAEPCRNWDTPAGCRRGISCAYQHRGFEMFTADGTMVTRCLNCGSLSHVVKESRAPGGGQDPDKGKALEEYRARRSQHAPASMKGQKGGKSYGKASGSGKSQAYIEQSGTSNQAVFTGKGKKDKGKERYAHAITSFAASHGSSSFPKGAAGLDSWANVYLKYVNFDKLDDKALAELEVLKLADGSTTKCATGVGEKGIPTAYLPRSSSVEQIDLLPVSWLVCLVVARVCGVTSWSSPRPRAVSCVRRSIRASRT